MLLALDVGNTQTVIGAFDLLEEDSVKTRHRSGELDGLRHHWRVSTDVDRTADEHFLLFEQLLSLIDVSLISTERKSITGIALCSSVPSITAAIREMASLYVDIPLVVVEPGVRTGLSILYDNPKEVGADRIANAVAAIDLYDGPLIVVDLGTATTFDAISANKEYFGGAIAPGIEVAMDALFSRAAALRRVELVVPRNVIGRSTVESMQSGAIYGNAAMVDGMCDRIQKEIGKSTIIATGGLAELVAPHSSAIQYLEPWLTLHGLRLVFSRNSTVNSNESVQ